MSNTASSSSIQSGMRRPDIGEGHADVFRLTAVAAVALREQYAGRTSAEPGSIGPCMTFALGGYGVPQS